MYQRNAVFISGF